MVSTWHRLGEVATIYPPDATPEQKESNKVKRVEIFKMPGGTEYVIHDVDENGIIIGKARFSGTVKVPDEAGIEAFFAPNAVEKPATGDDQDDDDDELDGLNSDGGSNVVQIKVDISGAVAPPSFYPPSFGVTVLGNSHGFDKNGSTSGYVLWVNGRGIMIDPPPYSSVTMEREGIRPQMIVAIIITHCHADHDAGAFQKVLTGSRVAMITTPTIYKSFIRKYAALSGLSPTLLRHSHRHRPAIIGQPLKFQGATFHFTYTLHTIPCIAFKVEWRGRSIVFTGDHLNLPPLIQQLEDKVICSQVLLFVSNRSLDANISCSYLTPLSRVFYPKVVPTGFHRSLSLNVTYCCTRQEHRLFTHLFPCFKNYPTKLRSASTWCTLLLFRLIVTYA